MGEGDNVQENGFLKKYAREMVEENRRAEEESEEEMRTKFTEWKESNIEAYNEWKKKDSNKDLEGNDELYAWYKEFEG